MSGAALAPSLPPLERIRSPERPVGQGPYLRSYRAQPRPRVSPRVIVSLLLAAALLFLQVWERTAANSLSMERDRLVRDVRDLENKIRISRELREQAAFKSGLDLASLGRLGFETPNPTEVFDIDQTQTNPAPSERPSFGASLLGAARRILPHAWLERVLGLPAAPVDARRGR